MSRRLTTEEYHRFRGQQKQKSFDSMAYEGRKKPNDKARERFRRPAYGGLYSSKGSGGDENGREKA